MREKTEALTVRQETVLRLRFGRERRAATYDEVAKALGVSPRTVQRIESEALRRLRASAHDPVLELCGWDDA